MSDALNYFVAVRKDAMGLSRIIWAIDIILKMDIPEFNPDLMGKEKQWHRYPHAGT